MKRDRTYVDDDFEDDDFEDDDDEQPPARPRRLGDLWQAYLIWDELVETRKRHDLRIQAIASGKSNLNRAIEEDFKRRLDIDRLIDEARADLVRCGEDAGPIWDWMRSIKGLGRGRIAASILAYVDDIGRFDNISKLWRFAGMAVIDGQAERNQRGKKAHFSYKFKSTCWLLGDQFLRQQTPGYVDMYYDEKRRQQQAHPEIVKVVNKRGKTIQLYTPAHLHARAMRRMIKLFLAHLWLEWRRIEGLPITDPYPIAILGHSGYIPPVATVTSGALLDTGEDIEP